MLRCFVKKLVLNILNIYSRCSEISNTGCLPKMLGQFSADPDPTASEEAV